MEKRLFLAIGLSLLIIISWSRIVSKFYPIEKQEVITITPSPVVSPLKESRKEIPSETLAFENADFVFLLPFAAIKEVRFKHYQNYGFALSQGFLCKDLGGEFKMEKRPQGAYFIYEDEEKRITKEFIFDPPNYNIELKIKIQNLKSQPLNLNPQLILAKLEINHSQIYSRLQEAAFAYPDKILRLSPRRSYSSGEEIKFLGFRDRYFCAIIEPGQSGFKGFMNKLNAQQTEIGLTTQLQIEAGGESSLNFHIYLGPQDLRILSAINKSWESIVYFGTFDAISKFLLKFLTLLQGIVHNWGFALVLLSLGIYFILYPLTLKQLRSMKKMQELQPKIEELRQLYKNNPQKLNKEVLELYRQEKVNPFGGCLPLILQIPIFFALYQALMRSLELKGEAFLWIRDLSEPDRLFILSRPLPFLGNEINLLPLLMMGIMFFQQKFSQTPSVGQAAEQQRLMGIIFPLLFGAIFYHMPAGLVLYWLINSALMTAFQLKTKVKH